MAGQGIDSASTACDSGSGAQRFFQVTISQVNRLGAYRDFFEIYPICFDQAEFTDAVALGIATGLYNILTFAGADAGPFAILTMPCAVDLNAPALVVRKFGCVDLFHWW